MIDEADELNNTREFVTSRIFSAPRQVVFRAFSDPEVLARWWGPEGFSNTFQEFDLRAGGTWRFVMHGPDGADFQSLIEFVEVRAPERIVMRHLEPMHTFTLTISFDDADGGTLLTWRMVFDSDEEADRVRPFIPAANEQNLDRLESQLAALV